MSIFILDKNPKLCAQYTCDKHLSIEIINISHILCTSMKKSGIPYGFKKYQMKLNHPFVLWVEEKDDNFLWLRQMGMELCRELSYRYSNSDTYGHTYEHIIRDTYPKKKKKNFNWKKDKRLISTSKFPQCIPNHFKHENEIKGYRDYYLSDKNDILQYTKRNVPKWMEELGLGEHK